MISVKVYDKLFDKDNNFNEEVETETLGYWIDENGDYLTDENDDRILI